MEYGSMLRIAYAGICNFKWGMSVGWSESAEFSMNSLPHAVFPSFSKRFSYTPREFAILVRCVVKFCERHRCGKNVKVHSRDA